MSSTILAIETSTQACSAAVLTSQGVFEEFELAPQQHADKILSMVTRVLEKAGCAPDEVDCLAYANGPGAFTGVRIAAGVIQGLAYGWQKPVIEVSTLEALIHQAWLKVPTRADQTWIACMDARMQEVYWQTGQRNEQGELVSEPPQMLSRTQALKRVPQGALGIGDMAWAWPEWEAPFSEFVSAYPRASDVAQVAALRVSLAQPVTQCLPQPLYLRNQVTG
jgi:tRNA threonylcarbamoyladenosine biosynthesis protein TsaB